MDTFSLLTSSILHLIIHFNSGIIQIHRPFRPSFHAEVSMKTNGDDLISLWLNHFQDDNDTSPNNQNTPSSATENVSKPVQDTPETPIASRATPILIGKLATYLAKQPPRNLPNKLEKWSSKDKPWTIDNVQTKAIVAMALILASDLTRFASTTFSEPHLIKARNELLADFSAREAVKIEVEAYELLRWFAASMNETWSLQNAPSDTPSTPETSEAAIINIMTRAIRDHFDLNMRYYTSSSGKFSERRITPIEVTAEKFLIAFCHLRNEERVFRLSRIVRLSPADGSNDPSLIYPNPDDTKLPPLEVPKTKKKSSSSSKKSTKQKTTHPKSTKPKEVSAPNSEKSAAPTLFDYLDTQKAKSKKKKADSKKKPAERSLFDE